MFFNNKEFVTTLTELNAIAPPAIIGLNNQPVKGYKTPAAIGIVVYLSTLLLLILASVPVEVINSFYRKKKLGLKTSEAFVKILKQTIMWVLILMIGYYIFGSR